jgi:hypothetical protein
VAVVRRWTEAAAAAGSLGTAFRWLEGRGVDDKCLESFVRLMWCCCSTWQGLGDGGAVGRRRSRAAAAEEQRRARGQGVLVGEMENGRHYELQEGEVVLVVRRRQQLTGRAEQAGGGRRGLGCKCSKVQGAHCKA